MARITRTTKSEPPSAPKFQPGDLVRFKPGYPYKYPVAGTLGEVRGCGETRRFRIHYRGCWRYPVYSISLGIIRLAKEYCIEYLPPLDDEEEKEKLELVNGDR